MTSKPRPRDELLALLAARLDEFRDLDPETQQQWDRERFLTTEETHGLLDHYLTFGHFADESEFGTRLKVPSTKLTSRRGRGTLVA